MLRHCLAPLMTWIAIRGSNRLRCLWLLQVIDRARHARVPAARNRSGLTPPPCYRDEQWRGSRTGSGRRFLARGSWCTFLFIVWLLLLHTLRFDTQRYVER